MTLYAERLPSRSTRDIFEFESSVSEVMGASFDQALFENPTAALNRITELNNAMYGEPVIAPGTQGSVSRLRDPETPLIAAEDARTQVEESGLDLKIPDEGIRQGALDILLRRKREERQRQIIIGSAPRGAAPLAIASSFAASALDPLNIASAFIPVVGETRITAMLSRAGTAGGRFATRAGVGAVEGAVGAAIVEPLVLAASAQDQADYDMADSLLNIAFGTVLGGGLHAIGGGVADVLRARPSQAADQVPEVAIETPEARPVPALDVFEPESVRDVLSQQARADLDVQAEQMARASVLSELEQELAPIAAQKIGDVGDLKKEQARLQQSLDSGFDDSFKRRAKEFQGEGLSRKRAERAAREAIAQDKADAEARLQAIESRLQDNRIQEQARQYIAEVRRGKVPSRYQERFEQAVGSRREKPLAAAIRTARERASEAPHNVRAAALKSGVSQLLQGQPVDVEDLFRLADEPGQAIRSIKAKKPFYNEADILASADAQRVVDTVKSDVEGLRVSVAEEEALVDDLSAQLGIKPDLDEADKLATEAQAYANAYRAYAVCSMRS